MPLTAAQSATIRDKIAECLGIDRNRVVAEANFFSDLGGTGQHLRPLRLATESALGISVEPTVDQVNARTALGADGLLTAESLAAISEYLGEQAGLPVSPVPFTAIFTVAFMEAMHARALADQSALSSETRPAAITLDPEYAKVVHKQLASFLEVPAKRLTPSARLLGELGGDAMTLAFAMAKVELVLGVKVSKTWDQLTTHLEDLDQGRATATTIEQLRIYLPDLDPHDPETHTAEATVTVRLIEQLVAQAIAASESPDAAQNGKPRRPVDSPVVAAWSWSQQDWMWQLADQLGPRKLRLLLAGGCRHASEPGGKLEFEIEEALQVLERFADGELNKTELKKTYRMVGTWKTWRYPTLDLLHHALSDTDPAAALPRLATALASAYRLDEAATLARIERLVAELVSPLADGEVFDPAWRSTEAVELAGNMYEARDFADMPRLAELLEQAGCDQPAILNHCRDTSFGHFRGCWVIDAVLDLSHNPTQPARTKHKRTGKSGIRQASGKSPDSIPTTKLTTAQQAVIETVMNDLYSYGQATVWELIDAKSRREVDELSAMRAFYAVDGLPEEQLLTICRLGEISNDGVYAPGCLRAGIARRFAMDAPLELALRLAFAARFEWLTTQWDANAHLEDLFRSLLQAAAAHDFKLIDRIVELVPPEIDRPNNRDYALILSALAGLCTNDEERLQQAAAAMTKRKPSAYIKAIGQVLIAVAAGSAEQFAEAMQKMLTAYPRYMYGDDVYRLVDPHAVGLYELCRIHRPAIVELFDTNQKLPWDAGYHAWLLTCDDISQHFAPERVPEAFRQSVIDLQALEWGAAMKAHAIDVRARQAGKK